MAERFGVLSGYPVLYRANSHFPVGFVIFPGLKKRYVEIASPE
jgi:hypothetical protein